jgi:adenylate kinase family enzyme
MRRIAIWGTSGSGKTTLARELSRRLNVPHIELDALYWEPSWTPAARDVFRQRVADAVGREAWVLCGGYASVRDLVLARADTAIWLDYPMRIVFLRVLRRTLRRSWTREELWSGNRESLRITFCSKNSLLLWVVNTWRRRRRDYPKLLKSDACRHLKVVRFRSPREAQAWLRAVSGQRAT